LQHQRRMVQLPAFVAITSMKPAQIQPLHHTMHKETKMVHDQNIAHTRRQQLSLIRTIRQITRHTPLSTNPAEENKFSHRLFSPWGMLFLSEDLAADCHSR